MESRTRVIVGFLVPALIVWGIMLAADYLFPHTTTQGRVLHVTLAVVPPFTVYGIIATRALEKRRRVEKALQENKRHYTSAEIVGNLVTTAGILIRTGWDGPREPIVYLVLSRINGGWAMVSVADNGTGIPEDKLNQGFHPFYTTKEVGKGTGLGLSTCYGIISRHDGLIRAENNEAGGATFTIEYTPG